MSIRTAIAGMLVDLNLVSEVEMFGPTGITAVDRLMDSINEDADLSEPQIIGIIAKATDPFGMDGSGQSNRRVPPSDVLARMRQLGLIVAVDQLQINLPDMVLADGSIRDIKTAEDFESLPPTVQRDWDGDR